MKKHFFKLRNITAILTLTGFMLTTANTSFANKNVLEILSSEPVQSSVKYISSDENSSAYQVKFDAAAPVKFQLVIKDKVGMVLFSQLFEAASFSKTFKVMEDERNNSGLTFSITTLPDGKVSNFKVSSEEKTVTEVTVNKTK